MAVGLRVVFYVPSVHTQSCLVLRDWILRRDRGEVLIVTTPKLSSGRRSAASQAMKILRQSGLGYLVAQARATQAYTVACRREARLGVELAARTNLRPEDYLACPGVAVRPFVDINSQPSLDCIKAFAPDVSVAVFFNQIVKSEALKLPRQIALNVHPSLLPAYRGISPVFRVLAHGESESGVSIHEMTKKVDFGNVLAQARTSITPNDTVFGLYRRIAKLGSEALASVLGKIAAGEVPAVLEPTIAPSQFGVIDRAALREFRSRRRRWYAATDFQ